MAGPFVVLSQQLELVAVCASCHLVSGPVHAAVELVEDAVVLVQVTELHSRGMTVSPEATLKKTKKL